MRGRTGVTTTVGPRARAPLLESASGGLRSQRAGAGLLLELIREGRATTRAELARHTGLARSTVAQRVDALIERRLVTQAPGALSTGGRPPARLAFNAGAGVVLSVDLDPGGARLAISDLAGEPLTETTHAVDMTQDPGSVLAHVADRVGELLHRLGRDREDVDGIGVCVPGPVDAQTGRPLDAAAFARWQSVSIADWFRARYDVPIRVDSAASMMAVGEHALHWPEVDDLLFVRLGMDITCGIVSGGRLLRGHDGTAGGIGHMRLRDRDRARCGCGAAGCLEAVAGGRAIVDRLAAQGVVANCTGDIGRLARERHPAAIQLMRDAGRALGEVLASVVNMFAPEVIVLGGELAAPHDELLAGAREMIYRRAMPVGTTNLRTVPSRLGARAAMLGAAVAVAREAVSPAVIDRRLDVGSVGAV